MTYLLLGLLVLFVGFIFVHFGVESRCRASNNGTGPHDWLYFGTDPGPEPYGRYWDRQCQACGKYD